MSLRLRDYDVKIILWTAIAVGAGAWLAVDMGGWNPLAILFFGFLGFIFVSIPLSLVLAFIYRCIEGIGELRDRLRYGRFLGR